MEAASRLINTLLPLLYALTVAAYAADFFREDAFARRAAHRLMELTLLLHVAHLALRTALYDHVPLASLAELATTVAFAVAFVYVVVERRSGSTRTGLFVVSFALVAQTLSSAFLETTNVSFPPILKSPLFAAHTIAAVIGYAAFAVSAIYGVLYLLLHHELKRSRFGLVYERLPPLEVLARMSLRAVLVGVAALTVTIACGSLWASSRFPGFTHDPKFLLTVAVWLVYGLAIALHWGRGWSGRRTITMSLVAFGLLVFSMVAAKVLFESFHVFA
jgi:HemX protein